MWPLPGAYNLYNIHIALFVIIYITYNIELVHNDPYHHTVGYLQYSNADSKTTDREVRGT